MAYQGTPSYSGVPASQYSDWVTRVAASLIDAAPVIAAWVVVYIIEIAIGGLIVDLLLSLIFFAATVAYTVYNRFMLGGGTGQTFGKQRMHIKLVSEQTGQPIGAMNAFIRDICHILDGFCFVGYLFPLWDPKRQTFADKIMNTIVIPA